MTGASATTLEDTTITALRIGDGGDGGTPGGSAGADIVGGDFNWINPAPPFPPPDVTLIPPTVFLP